MNNIAGYEPPSVEDYIKEAQIKMLNELKASISIHEPSMRQKRDSSFDNGKSNGLWIASNLIDIMIAKINAG